MPHAHEEAGKRSVAVAIITVSDTRTAETDNGGDTVAAGLQAAGHSVASRAIVPDDREAIARALEAALASVDAQAVVLTGGTGVSARDVTIPAVEPFLARDLPGFGELFRALSFAEIGPAAMLSGARAGLAAFRARYGPICGRPVFAIPGSVAACRLAVEKLIGPELGHLVSECEKDAHFLLDCGPQATYLPSAPATAPAAHAPPPRARAEASTPPLPSAAPLAPPKEGIVLDAPSTTEPPASTPSATGWRAGLAALGGTLTPGSGDLPEGLARIPAARDVLATAGQRAGVTLADGTTWSAYGFPDLQRDGSKVLLIREAPPVAEVVVLHRWPARCGLVSEDGEGVLPSAVALAEVETRTGRAHEGAGLLFALDRSAAWIVEGRTVTAIDAKGARHAGPVATVVGSLLLGWSQR
jgi:molybdenum cofactor biosynthesis protein B